jgi:hypothetical protein
MKETVNWKDALLIIVALIGCLIIDVFFRLNNLYNRLRGE